MLVELTKFSQLKLVADWRIYWIEVDGVLDQRYPLLPLEQSVDTGQICPQTRPAIVHLPSFDDVVHDGLGLSSMQCSAVRFGSKTEVSWSRANVWCDLKFGRCDRKICSAVRPMKPEANASR
jgi:hypothetical protein